jgi:5-methylthioadenosine/S-adenosylhomocysteine deaminase
MQYDLIFKNAVIIDANGEISEQTNIYIKNGRIEKVASAFEGTAAEIADCSGFFVTPGFVNLHVHAAMNLLKGIAEDVNIEQWFNREVFPYESRLGQSDIYWGTLLAIAEMIDNGVTAFADHYFFGDQISQAVVDGGIRADIAPTVFGVARDFEEQLAAVSAMIERNNGTSGRVSFRMGPHAPYTCPPEQLKAIIHRARELQVGIHIHVSETSEQVAESIRMYGRTPFALLYESGGFELPVIIGHGLWLQSEDVQYLNNRTHLAVCPKTYMKLGMGSGTLWERFDSLPLCIGTDGAASSNSLSPLEQARLFALAGKWMRNEPEQFTLKQIWRLLMRGHEALNFHTGKISPGYAADLLVWDLAQTNTAPVYNPLASIIYSADCRNILHSIIAGKFVKKNGKIQMDTGLIINQVRKIQNGLLQSGKGRANIKY